LKRFFLILLKALGIAISLLLLVLAGILIKYQSVINKEPGAQQGSFQATGYAAKVNPFIGTGGYPWVSGNNFPGAALPFSVVRLSPETVSILGDQEGNNTSGYHYWDNKIIGFSHTRLSGTGASDGGHFRLIPGYGEAARKSYLNRDFLTFSHEDEQAFPGYYAVNFPKKGILAEFTTSMRTGIHRYTFEHTDPHILIDISSTIARHKAANGYVKILPEEKEIIGHISTFGTFASRYEGIKVYFSATFDQAFDSYGIWTGVNYEAGLAEATSDSLLVDIGFAGLAEGKNISVKLGISHVSIENARENRIQESKGLSFEEILQKARLAWEEKLSLIEIETDNQELQEIFYTAMYRSFIMPSLFTDTNGEYTGFDKQLHLADSFGYYTDLSLWDTFRTTHPLYVLIAPEQQRDMLRSMVKMKEQGGYLPRWPSGTGYSNSMLGSPAAMLIAESYLKGIRDFEVESAYQGLKTLASEVVDDPFCSGRKGIKEYLEYGYCPSEMMDKAVGRTLEYAWADYSTAKLAEALGHDEDAKRFFQQSLSYKELWNPETKYFHPKTSQGSFDPIEPLQLTYTDWEDKLTNDYVEGSALQWRWMLPFDSDALVELFGSKEYFVQELNDFFEKADPAIGTLSPGPYYWQGNQPDMHAAYLFNAAGRPDLTQKWVRWILKNKYTTASDGLDGNDDGATLSAWYIFSAMGFYPVAGTDRYELGIPLFKKAILPVGKHKLEIIAENFSAENNYVDQIFLNGELLKKTWISHEVIAGGGQLRFVLTSIAPQGKKQ